MPPVFGPLKVLIHGPRQRKYESLQTYRYFCSGTWNTKLQDQAWVYYTRCKCRNFFFFFIFAAEVC